MGIDPLFPVSAFRLSFPIRVIRGQIPFSGFRSQVSGLVPRALVPIPKPNPFTTDYADDADVGIKPDRLASVAAQPPRFCVRKTSVLKRSSSASLVLVP
jgi:hypothetical protein